LKIRISKEKYRKLLDQTREICVCDSFALCTKLNNPDKVFTVHGRESIDGAQNMLEVWGFCDHSNALNSLNLLRKRFMILNKSQVKHNAFNELQFFFRNESSEQWFSIFLSPLSPFTTPKTGAHHSFRQHFFSITEKLDVVACWREHRVQYCT